MAAFSTVIAVAGLGLAAYGAYEQSEAREDQQDALEDQAAESKKQAEIAQRRADLEHHREIRASMRQARIQRAAIINQGANSGTLGSSGVAGGAGSVLSQFGANVAFSGAIDGLNEQSTASSMRSADANAAYGQAQGEVASGAVMGSLGSTIFSGAGGFSEIFNPGGKKKNPYT